ncbi:MAG: TetR/AcrR family transcriptional regulator [bacterium]
MQNNKKNIMDVALNLFSLQGYESVGVQKIVDEAKITKPTLYYYFGNKKGLLEAVLQENFTKLIEQLKNSISAKNKLKENLQLLTLNYFEFAKQNSLFYRLQLTLFFSPPESETHAVVLKHNNAVFELVVDIFKMHEDNKSEKRNVRFAFTFLGMINNYISLYLGNLIKLEEDSAEKLVNQFLYGIKGNKK